MNAAARLGLFGLGLVAVFGVAAAASGAIAPDGIATEWTASQKDSAMQDHSTAATEAPAPSAHDGHGGPARAGELGGLSLSAQGLTLDTVTAPTAAGEPGELSFRILDGHGEPVTEYEREHDKDLHLIVVRSDGAEFRHVHPEMDAAGVWSIDWSWREAGSYRVFADFTASGAEAVTLSRSVQVSGAFAPVDPQPARHARVAGYDVHLRGDLAVGAASELTVEIAKNGAPVTALEPYLGAFGHLVALRQGDLGYAHVHPEGDAPRAGDTSGPDVSFAASVPTAGRYLLYFDFQVEGAVHSVPFVVDTTDAAQGDDSDDHQH
ncbi:heavy-metal-associated domain-containing protein [Microbacterium sp.]|uniref:heavy-metal-associated domain-containing protein n=1 Tax=Microbacterium sp. TaxID=51671 RepID=UPI0028123EC6|nr:heavy-metal-associated domain-containing protein [Microbacterium sp.]